MEILYNIFEEQMAGFRKNKGSGKGNYHNLQGLTVEVINNNIDGALRLLKRKMSSELIYKELKDRESYEKPSATKRRKHAEAINRTKRNNNKNLHDY